MTKWVYGFGDGKAVGEQGMKNLLGRKGANLAEMLNIGLPVPPGVTVTPEVFTYYCAIGRAYPPELKTQVEAALAEIGRITGKTFGDAASIKRCERAGLGYVSCPSIPLADRQVWGRAGGIGEREIAQRLSFGRRPNDT